MSNLNIQNYPNASFDKDYKLGYLDNYNYIRQQILDYKAGADYDIDFFVKPMLELINYSLADLKQKEAALIPIPSSRRNDDPEYNTMPSKDKYNKEENRDNRNLVFCEGLSKEDSKLIYKGELVLRIKNKKKKEKISVEEHIKSLKLCDGFNPKEISSNLIILDDVCTTGNTSEAVIEILKKHVRTETQFIRLFLGKR